MTDDLTLLRRYVDDRSDEAFAELVRRHLPLVYSAASRRLRGDAHRAHDVAQIVFTALAREAASLTRHPSLVGWLYTATRHAASGLIRTEQRRVAREQAAHAMDEIHAPSEPAADWDRLRPVLDDALDELDARDREAVLLRFFHQQQFAAVAQALRVSEEAARKRVDRALERLGALLARRGITSTASAVGLALAGEAAAAVPATAATTITTAALAGAGLGASAVPLSLLTIMTTTKLITGTAAAVAVVAVGAALYQMRAAQDSASAVTALNAERSSLNARMAGLEQQKQAADQSLASAQKELGDLRARAAQPAAPAPSLQHGSAIDYVLAHPETHAAYVERQALRALARYDRFIKSANLTAEQQERFAKGLRDLAAIDFDFMVALHSQGYGVGNLPRDPAAVRELQAPGMEKKRAFAQEMRTVLGDERMREFMEFGRATAERNVADELAGRLYYTDSALTPRQADQLVEILLKERLNPQAADAASAMHGTAVAPQALQGALAQALQLGGLTLLDWHAPVSDAALARLGTVLAPGQLAALKQLQAEQLQQLQLAPPPPAGFVGGPR